MLLKKSNNATSCSEFFYIHSIVTSHKTTIDQMHIRVVAKNSLYFIFTGTPPVIVRIDNWNSYAKYWHYIPLLWGATRQVKFWPLYWKHPVHMLSYKVTQVLLKKSNIATSYSEFFYLHSFVTSHKTTIDQSYWLFVLIYFMFWEYKLIALKPRF